MSNSKETKWERPILTVLSKANPEHRVLDLCKWSTGQGSNNFNMGCYFREPIRGCEGGCAVKYLI